MFDEETYAAAVAYAKAHGGGSGSSNYNDLTNLPKINGNTLTGNKTSASLGIHDVKIVGDALVIN
jgi:hypothetical protein